MPVTVLELAGEGGTLSLVACRSGRRWVFRVTSSEAALEEFVEEVGPAPKRPEQWLESPSVALAAYPWLRLTPVAVDPDFKVRILEEVGEHRLGGKAQVIKWRRELRKARRLGSRLNDVLENRDRFTGLVSSQLSGAVPCDLAVFGPATGRDIATKDDWFHCAPPAKGRFHWKDGRSALEAARAWCGNDVAVVPRELQNLFDSVDVTRDLRIATVIPEHRTKLDDFGRGRQHDLVAYGMAGRHRVVVCIEAKADESFGSTIGQELARARTSKARAVAAGRRATRVEDRIQDLAKLVFGGAIDEGHEALRYQLLHGIAGTVLECQAAKGDVAVFVVHEFVSQRTKPSKLEKNKADLNAFVRALSGSAELEHGRLVGPMTLGGGKGKLTGIPLWTGKVSTKCR